MDARSLRPKRSVTAANGVAQPLAAPVGAAPAVPAAQQSALVPAPSAAAAPAVLTAEQRFAAARTLGADRAAVLRAAVARAPRSNYRKVVLKDKGTLLAPRGTAVPGICPASGSKNGLDREQVPLLIPREELATHFGLSHGKLSCMDHYEIMYNVKGQWTYFYPVEQLIDLAAVITGKPARLALERLAVDAAVKEVRKQISEEEAEVQRLNDEGRRKTVLRGWLHSALRSVFHRLVLPATPNPATGELSDADKALRVQQLRKDCTVIRTCLDSAMLCTSAASIAFNNGEAIDAGKMNSSVDHWVTCWILECMARFRVPTGTTSAAGVTIVKQGCDFSDWQRSYTVVPIASMPMVHARWSREVHCTYNYKFKYRVREFIRQLHFSGWGNALGREVVDIIIAMTAPRFDAIAMRWYYPGEEQPRFPDDGFFPDISVSLVTDKWKGVPKNFAPVRKVANVLHNRFITPVQLSETSKHPSYTIMGQTRKDGVAAVPVTPHWTSAERLYTHVYARTRGHFEFQTASERAQEVATAFAEAEDGSFAWAAQHKA